MQNPVTGPSVRGSLVTDPKVRAWTFQILAIATVVAVGWYLFHNTQSNLAQRGITSGFAFLNNSAGFGILQSLIDYTEGDTYGRVFVVGLLNTLLVSALGIVIATIIGFVVGVSRLSPNWLISRLAAVYIEIFRNIPPLLQIFFWYFAVLRAMPPPRGSHAVGDAVFLNIRGLYLPSPTMADGFWFFVAALALAATGCVALARWARARREATGQRHRRAMPLASAGMIDQAPTVCRPPQHQYQQCADECSECGLREIGGRRQRAEHGFHASRDRAAFAPLPSSKSPPERAAPSPVRPSCEPAVLPRSCPCRSRRP